MKSWKSWSFLDAPSCWSRHGLEFHGPMGPFQSRCCRHPGATSQVSPRTWPKRTSRNAWACSAQQKECLFKQGRGTRNKKTFQISRFPQLTSDSSGNSSRRFVSHHISYLPPVFSAATKIGPEEAGGKAQNGNCLSGLWLQQYHNKARSLGVDSFNWLNLQKRAAQDASSSMAVWIA